jgi:hypothetical protein
MQPAEQVPQVLGGSHVMLAQQDNDSNIGLGTLDPGKRSVRPLEILRHPSPSRFSVDV